jgi:citrate lyase subunit beta/citryl-CoA lyase
LFVPADRSERLAKARNGGADAIIADLEDSVAVHAKESARAALFNALTSAHPVWVRVNGAETPWFRTDLDLCREPGVCGVVLSKAERVDDLDRIAAALPDGTPILALIETAIGLWNALALARHPSVVRLLFGSIDFQLDTGIQGDGRELDTFRSRLVLLSKVAEISPPVDGVTRNFDDVDSLREESLHARRFGFGGKLCIHPRQVAIVNECFSPSPEELQWAQTVVAASVQSGGAAFALDNKMIDNPVVARAQAILCAGRRGATRGNEAI